MSPTRPFCLAIAALLQLATPACAQVLVSDTDCAKATAFLDYLNGPRLDATLIPLRPALNFAFRFFAGYVLSFPLKQFAGTKPNLAIVARVTSREDSHRTVCFSTKATLPGEVPAGFHEYLQLGGGFLLGTGTYDVQLTAIDDAGRVWRKSLTYVAALRGAERRAVMLIAPGAIEPLQRMAWTPRAASDGKSRRLTVLLHAASLYGRRTVLNFADSALLLSSLSTVLSECRFNEVRVIAFNRDQRRELFRQDHFDPKGFRILAGTLFSVKLQKVPVEALQPGKDIIESLLETESANKDHAVLILGPYARDESKPEDLPCRSGSGPQLFYFQHRVNFIGYRRPVEYPDRIERLVHGCSGEVYRIHTPSDLAIAIEKFNRKTSGAAEAKQ